MINILITSVGSNTAISVIKGFAEIDEKVTLYGVDSNNGFLCAGNKFVKKFFKISPACEESDYILDLIEIINDLQIDVLIPIHDFELEVLSKNKNRLKSDLFVVNNEYNVVEKCNDKLLANKFAKKCRLKVPQFYTNLENISNADFPLIAKTINGVGAKSLVQINNFDDVEFFIKGHDVGEYFFQKYIDGIEYTVDCYCSYYDYSFVGGLARERIEIKDGICTKGKTVEYPQLIDYCEDLLNKLSFVGPANIQFIKDNNDNFYFIEINPRFSGTFVLSLSAGFNICEYIIDEYRGRKPSRSNKLIYNLYMSRYWEESFSNEKNDCA